MEPTPKEIETMAKWLHKGYAKTSKSFVSNIKPYGDLGECNKDVYRRHAVEILTNPPKVLIDAIAKMKTKAKK